MKYIWWWWSKTADNKLNDDETNSNSIPNEKLKKPNPNPWIGWIVSIQYDTSEMSEVEKEKCTKIGTAPSSSKGWHGLCHDGQSVRWCKQGSRHCLLLPLLLRFTSLANQELSSTPQELPGVHPSLPTIAAVSISCKDLFAGVCARSFHRKMHHSCVKRS